jgi:hypothetical protein
VNNVQSRIKRIKKKKDCGVSTIHWLCINEWLHATVNCVQRDFLILINRKARSRVQHAIPFLFIFVNVLAL